jgi:phosphoglycerol transferase
VKLAIQNAFPNHPIVAETELIHRFAIAARKLGWQAVEVVTSDDIVRFGPDWVLATHYCSPKLTQFLTLGMMTNPSQYFHDRPEWIRNILSYDGYLSGSPPVTQYLNDLLFPTGKKVPTSDFPFLPSTHATEFVERPPADYRLFYVGTRWNADRHGGLFEQLSKVIPLDVYGPANRWKGVDCNYRGEIRPDGRSLLVKLRQSGAALCIHSKEHRAWQLPTMRVFEAAAAGAVILADDFPLIREHFREVILPVDTDLPVDGVVEQVSEHLAWINHHPCQALEMARQAHAIFCEKFCLERQFERLPAFLDLVREAACYTEDLSGSLNRAADSLAESNGRGPRAGGKRHWIATNESSFGGKGIITASSTALASVARRDTQQCTAPAPSSEPIVEYIVCLGQVQAGHIDRCLRSIQEQTYKSIGLILVRSDGDGADDSWEKYRSQFVSLRLLSAAASGRGSNALWTGLRAVTAPYLANLRPDHRLHPNHVARLMKALREDRDLNLAQASSLEVRSSDGAYFKQWNFDGPLGQEIPENRRLSSLGPVELDDLIESADTISACSWIARRELLTDAVLEDPELSTGEDVYLAALLLSRSRSAHTWSATCERHATGVTTSSVAEEKLKPCLERVRCRLALGTYQYVRNPQHEPKRRLVSLAEDLRRHLQDVRQEFGQRIHNIEQELKECGRQIDQQKFERQIQNAELRELAARVHHAAPSESHALHRLAQGYLALRGSWKVFTGPRHLPGRCWRGLATLVGEGPRKFLGRLSRIA